VVLLLVEEGFPTSIHPTVAVQVCVGREERGREEHAGITLKKLKKSVVYYDNDLQHPQRV